MPEDWVERLIVGMLFAVSALGIFVLTGSALPAVLVGLLVGAVSMAVVAML